jgi:ArsR family transcriptional regulator
LEPILRTLKAAADASRLRILRILGVGPFHVAELQEILGLGQSTVSRHLKVLADAGLVDVRRAGTWAWYSLRPAGEDPAGRLVGLLFPDADTNGDAAAIRDVLERRRRTTSAFFRRAAPEWDALRDVALGPPTHLERLVALVGQPDTVVDLGTGTGVLLQKLAPIARHVIGVDASPEMLDLARHRAGANTELRLGALEHLPLRDGEADAMVANLVLHHLANPPEALREMGRGLRSGGRLVIADLEEHDRESFWQTLGAQWPGFRQEEIGAWLAGAGFHSVEFQKLDAASRAAPSLFLATATRN